MELLNLLSALELPYKLHKHNPSQEHDKTNTCRDLAIAHASPSLTPRASATSCCGSEARATCGNAAAGQTRRDS
eukprot:scaffold2114_cov253-Pinguiococcus_pyrenoidosus.AAC.4